MPRAVTWLLSLPAVRARCSVIGVLPHGGSCCAPRGARSGWWPARVAFMVLCKAHHLPAPVANTEVAGIEVDMHWPGTNLIVELDCYEYHRTPQEFENDRRRDAHLKRNGYDVLRVTDVWLDSDPEDV